MRLPSTVREVASSTKDIHPAVRELIEGAGRKIDRLLMRKTKLVCDMVREGSVDLDVVKEVYIDNLRLALRSIKELILRIKPFTSKIVISSDHGEIFHYNEFGHNDSYEYKDHPELYEIPWLILKKNKGKN